MERELVELFASVKKAADLAAADGVSSSGPEVSRCLDAFKLLSAFPVTKESLVATQVGKQLRHLTKHPRGKIQNAASDLLETWKKVVIEESSKSKKNGTMHNNLSLKTEVKVEKTMRGSAVNVDVETVKGERLHKGECTKSVNVVKSETVKVERRDAKLGSVAAEKSNQVESVKEEKTLSMKTQTQAPDAPPKLSSMLKCNDPVRDKIRELLAEALSKVAGEAHDDIRMEVDACDPIRVAVSVESAMFEKLGRSNGAEKAKYRSIMFNLKDQKNPDFRRKVLLGWINPSRIPTLSPEEMASDERQRENQQIKEKALFECERGMAPKATTDQFKCGRCGQRKCTYYQMQTRSADEPMTTYVTCVNCNNHWKFC